LTNRSSAVSVGLKSKNLDSCGKPFMSSVGKGISMVRDEHAIAACNDRALSAGMDIAVPVSSKTKAKTTTKTV
jgi:formate-dependent phosphoribosylglycinamide formyltransferase (GAR transformylase)